MPRIYVTTGTGVGIWLCAAACMTCLCCGCATRRELTSPPPAAVDHLRSFREAQEKIVDQYIKEKAWLGLAKPQMEYVLREHGFAGPFRYGPVYEDWWGKGYDEALFFERRYDDLWILFKNGKVANVGTIYRE